MNAMDRLIRPRSVAVIGASADPGKTTGRPIGYLQRHAFSGAIYPVNPRAETIGGLRCYPDIASLPETPDVGLVLLGPAHAHRAVRDLAARGTAAAIVLASGYGETGPDGARRQQELKEAAGSMRLLGPNGIGLVNLTDGIMLSATGALESEDLRAGRISLVSQSGGVMGSLLSHAAGRGIGFAKLVSTGNEADLDSSDFIDHLVDDEATAVIAVYMEGLRRPDAFRRAARRAAEAGKPIVVYKVGRSETGARSAASHTGALAGADRLYGALFRQLGVIRADRFSDLLDIPMALASDRRAEGKRTVILTSTGGVATLLADSLGVAGFDMPPPDAETVARLQAQQTDDQAVLDRNPVDVTLAGLQPKLMRGAINALLDSSSYDSVVVVVGSSALAQPDLVKDALVECAGSSGKPLLAYVSPYAPHIAALLNRAGIPAFTTPETSAVLLEAALRRPAPEPLAETVPAAPDVGDLPSGPLNEAESKALFARFGVPVTREEAAADSAGAEAAAQRLGGADGVVLKILSRHIAHKSDVGGVRVGIPAAGIREAGDTMLARVRTATGQEPEGFLVQERIRGGTEMILGFLRDPQLGPAILLGMGGVAVEVFDDTTLRPLPIARADAEAMVRELKSARLLRGYRGAAPADVPALVEAVLAFARMAESLGDRLAEAEINPLFVLGEGEGVRAADGLVVMR
jgi:acyl-CoA synthetase (NDP forming)